MKKGAYSHFKSSKFNAKTYEKPGLTEQQIQQIKEAFDLFDVDGTNSIDPRQLKLTMTNFGFQTKNQTIYQMICDLQADGSRNIDFDNFLQMMTARISQKDTRQNIKKIFNLFDDEKSGFISVKNLRKITKQLGETIDQQQLQQMIDKADLDQDGLVSEDQFYMIITKKGI